MDLPSIGELYAARLRSELDDLARAEQFLDAPAFHQRLPIGTADEIRTLIRSCRDTLRQNEGTLSWTGMAEARVRARRISTELFTVFQTNLLRDVGYDAAIFATAERLAAHLQGRSLVRRPTLLAVSPDTESFDHAVSVLRLKFPGTTVWQLPVLAHEYGHHATENLHRVSEDSRDVRPLHDIVEQEVAAVEELEQPTVRAWTHEYIADAFATYAMGSMYPLACLALRIAPNRALDKSSSHPPWNCRVEIMAATLEAVSKHTNRGGPASVANNVIRPLWDRLTDIPPLGGGQNVFLRHLAEKVVRELLRHTQGLLYDDADRAVALSDVLASGGPPPIMLEDASVVTVLDAAWRWRRENWSARSEDVARVNGTVLAWCALAGQRQDPEVLR